MCMWGTARIYYCEPVMAEELVLCRAENVSSVEVARMRGYQLI